MRYFNWIILEILFACPVLHAEVILLDRLEAAVNKTPIMLSNVKKFKQTLGLRAQLDPLFAGTTLAEKNKAASNKEIVEFLINEKVILQQFPLSDSEVEQSIATIQTENKIDRERLKKALSEQGYSFEDYFELIRISGSKRNLIDRDIRTKVNISDDDIKNYYFNNYAKSSSIPFIYRVKIITAKKQAIAVAKKKLSAGGTTFEEVAKKLSDHPTASSGGDLGELTEDQMSPQIRTYLKKMKVGEVSDVLGNASSGYFILKLSGIQTSNQERFTKVQEEIKNHLVTAEFQRQILLWQERERQKAFVHIAKEL